MRDDQKPATDIRDYRTVLRSLLTANTQTRLLLGLSFLMVLIIAFSNHQSSRETKSKTAQPIFNPGNPSPASIKTFQEEIDAASRKLAEDEAKLTASKKALQAAPPPSTAAYPRPYPAPEPSAFYREASSRRDASLFASNVALSYREPLKTTDEKRIFPDESRPGNTRVKSGLVEQPKFRVLEGTIIETVLTNSLDSAFSGPVKCLVTTAVYARDNHTVVIPEGTFVEGEARKVEHQGEQRLAVIFHRLIRPDDFSIDLNQSLALSQGGETGLRDRVNHHYLQVFGAALGIGAIAGISQANTRYGLDTSAADAYQQGVAGSLSQSSLHILDRYLNVMPTFTVRQGVRIKVYLSQDLMLPAYSPDAS